MLDGGEEYHLAVAVGNLVQDQDARHLRHSFYDQNSRHYWVARKVALEMGLIHGHVLDTHYAHVFQLDDAVDEEKWITMWKNLFYRSNVEGGHSVPFIITTMDSLLACAQAKQDEQIAFLRELVECESPSGDPVAIERFIDLLAAKLAGMAQCNKISSEYGPMAQFEFDLPGKRPEGQILALGHSDTVYSIGTLASMPFRVAEGRVYGPGVLDMKGGIASFVFAMRALRELHVPVRQRVIMQLNPDEEIGSPASRTLTEQEAGRSVAVLVVEPGTGLQGKAKTARKGTGDYVVTVRGISAHAGVDFTSGANAIVELARQIERIAAFTDLQTGVTVNPGVISGGTRTNVVAEEARVEVDIRVARLPDAAELHRRFQALSPVDPRCRLHVSGGLNRPPMERTPGVAALFDQARALAKEIGVELEESSTGGGSDGNFTAALAPTLDGIGAVGEGAHSPGESILISRIADRTALLAKLVAAI